MSISLQYSKEVRVPKEPKAKANALVVAPPTKEYDRKLETSVAGLVLGVLGVDPGRANLATVTYLIAGKGRRRAQSRQRGGRRSEAKRRSTWLPRAFPVLFPKGHDAKPSSFCRRRNHGLSRRAGSRRGSTGSG